MPRLDISDIFSGEAAKLPCGFRETGSDAFRRTGSRTCLCSTLAHFGAGVNGKSQIQRPAKRKRCFWLAAQPAT